jgi:molecular chaperone GrpE
MTKKEMTDKQKDETAEELHAGTKDETSADEEKKTGAREETSADEIKNKQKTAEAKQKKISKEKELKHKLQEQEEKYLRLSADFDNYRKRTLKEKIEMGKYAGIEILSQMLPVIDDFERAMKSMEETQDIDAVKQGIKLIYNKFKEYLSQQGVEEIEALHTEFDTDLHDAVTKIPAPEDELKRKVVDVIEKGYKLNDKVIRYSKVVVGE